MKDEGGRMKGAAMRNKQAGKSVYECSHCHRITTYVLLCSHCLDNPRIRAAYFDSALLEREAA
jgi:hypothetical protein